MRETDPHQLLLPPPRMLRTLETSSKHSWISKQHLTSAFWRCRRFSEAGPCHSARCPVMYVNGQ
jgi:hypothetical protein